MKLKFPKIGDKWTIDNWMDMPDSYWVDGIYKKYFTLDRERYRNKDFYDFLIGDVLTFVKSKN